MRTDSRRVSEMVQFWAISRIGRQCRTPRRRDYVPLSIGKPAAIQSSIPAGVKYTFDHPSSRARRAAIGEALQRSFMQ